MNRADRTPEPTMDEILASIRRIIADDDPVGEPAAAQAAVDESQDDILELTDEMFLGDDGDRGPQPPQEAAAPADGQNVFRRVAHEGHDEPAAREGGHARPVWSGRELSAGRQPQRRVSARTAPAGNWSGGIQMPIPDSGPAAPFEAVRMANGEPDQAGTGEAAPGQWRSPAAAGPGHEPVPHRSREDGKGGIAAGDMVAMQAVAEQLARQAVSDLTEAGPDGGDGPRSVVLDEPFMEAMTTTLVDALTRSKQGERSGLADERPSPEAAPQDAAEESGQVPQDVTRVALETAAGGVAAGAVQPEFGGSFTEDFSDSFTEDFAPPPVQPETVSPAAEAGPAPAKSLEDSVKELLRPMLRQWLDENMPRIVEGALREEMAASARAGGRRE